jgi:Ser/Thr protein kinase RdoA (MazF antagonist)
LQPPGGRVGRILGSLNRVLRGFGAKKHDAKQWRQKTAISNQRDRSWVQFAVVMRVFDGVENFDVAIVL